MAAPATPDSNDGELARLTERLRKLDLKAVPTVPNCGVPTLSRVKNVHDADTVEAVACFGDRELCFKVRISGIDAPEVTLKSGVTQLEKETGLMVGRYVAALLAEVELPKVVLFKVDKYGGRYVGDFFLADGGCLSAHLLAKGYVHPYDGGKKAKWAKRELQVIAASLADYA